MSSLALASRGSMFPTIERTHANHFKLEDTLATIKLAHQLDTDIVEFRDLHYNAKTKQTLKIINFKPFE